MVTYGPGDAQHVRYRHNTGHPHDLARVAAVGSGIDDDEAAASGVVFAHERKTCGGLVVAFDDDVLKEIAKTGLDGPLVTSIDIEIVRDRALLTNLAVGLDEDHPGRVAELAATCLELRKRREPRLACAPAPVRTTRTLRRRDSCSVRAASELRFARHGFKPHLLQRCLRARQRFGRRRPGCINRFSFAAQVVALDIELAERPAHALPLRCRVLHRVAQGRGGVKRRGYIVQRAASMSDVKALDPLLGPCVRFTGFRECRRRGVPRTCRLQPRPGRARPAASRAGSRRASRSPSSLVISAARTCKRLGLVVVELLLLLPAIDAEFPCVGILPDARCAAIRFRLLDAQAGQGLLRLRQPARRPSFRVRARLRQPQRALIQSSAPARGSGGRERTFSQRRSSSRKRL